MNSIVSITHCSSTDRLQLATSKNSQKNNRKKRKNNFIDHSMTPACTVHKNTSPLSFFFFLFFSLFKSNRYQENVLQEGK